MAINFNYDYPQVARDAGFKLRQFKDGPLDWRLMGSLEVERILRDQSIEHIDGVLSHLSEAPLGTMLETNILDSGIAKYFVLSQFSIQYLLFCRKFLDETVRDLRESHAESQMELARLKQSLAEANNEILSLHKKMTQMEAIHEVVYPCHLCTKNFVSNEALNIHIGRKHQAATREKERRTETPVSLQKERDSDLNLINTIKLELEIKQLKERLNTAEKDIRERSSVANSKRASPRESQTEQGIKAATLASISTRNIGIQSNLIEAKEKDDEDNQVNGNESAADERKEQFAKLQDKVREFENWREAQTTNNEESITEINKKLADIAEALERTRTHQEKEVEEKLSTMQRRVSPSVEDLQLLLTEKVAEIGKASAEKLEEVVEKLELSYIEKLGHLEREIKKKNITESKMMREEEDSVEHNKAKEAVERKEREKEQLTRIKRNVQSTSEEQITVVKAVKAKTPKTPKTNDDTYEIEDFNEETRDVRTKEQQNRKALERESAKNEREEVDIATESIASNQTFVKSLESKDQLRGLPKPQLITDDSTDISESLSEEAHTENDDDESTESEAEAEPTQLPKATKIVKDGTENTAKKNTKLENKEQPKEKRTKKVIKPKQFTRKDARRLTNRQLGNYGLDMKVKSVSNATLKRVSNELTEQRNNLKQKYPHFYATRSKIKKFVNKLCSAKMPESAEALLKRTQPLQPMEAPKPRASARLQYTTQSPEQTEDDEDEDNSSFETMEPEASTPKENNGSADAFKQRLERLLASPMRQPPSSGGRLEQKSTTAATVLVHPVPLPRKRVMFNTQHAGESSDEDFK